jgi:octopine/nopaline transport system permease protein
MSGALLFRRVIFPIALRQVLPAYSTEAILTTKSTALASIVTLKEFMSVAQKLHSQTSRAIEIFLCAGVVSLALNIVIARVIGLVEDRLSPHRRAAPALPGLDSPLELGAIR